MNPHSSFKVTTPYVRISVSMVVNNSRLLCEGKLTQLTSARLRICFEKLVDDSVEIHQASVFPQIIFRLSEEHVNLTVAASDGNFAWFG